ncbi:MAG: hypothetical protein ABSF98_12160 [Bryobacteraceae bacterium]
MDYIIAFLAVAFFGLLGGYATYLAIMNLEGQRKARALVVICSLTGLGLLAAALQQLAMYHSDRSHEKRESETQGKLDSSLQQQAYIRGQLDGISLLIGNVAEKNSDPSLQQIADAIAKMAQTNTPQTDSLRKEVVALIGDLKAFQLEREEAEDLAAGNRQQAITVSNENIRLFQQRYSGRLRRLAGKLPQYFSKESKTIREIADYPTGGNTGFIDRLVEVLRSVSASI